MRADPVEEGGVGPVLDLVPRGGDAAGRPRGGGDVAAVDDVADRPPVDGVAFAVPPPAADPLLDAVSVLVLAVGVDDRVGRPLYFQDLLRYRHAQSSFV